MADTVDLPNNRLATLILLVALLLDYFLLIHCQLFPFLVFVGMTFCDLAINSLFLNSLISLVTRSLVPTFLDSLTQRHLLASSLTVEPLLYSWHLLLPFSIFLDSFWLNSALCNLALLVNSSSAFPAIYSYFKTRWVTYINFPFIGQADVQSLSTL